MAAAWGQRSGFNPPSGRGGAKTALEARIPILMRRMGAQCGDFLGSVVAGDALLGDNHQGCALVLLG